MTSPALLLGEPVIQDARGNRATKAKLILLTLLFAGVGYGTVRHLVGGAQQQAMQEPNVDMAFSPTYQMRSIPSIGLGKPPTLASLPGPTALKNLVAEKIEANNRACPARDLRVKAEAAPAPAPAAEAPAEETQLAPVKEAPLGLYTGGKVGDSADVVQYMFNPSLTEPASKAKVEAMAGVTAPLGLFDPLGIATRVPEGQLLYFREAELKHGRVCMLAFLGLLVGEAHAYNFMPVLPFESALGLTREISGSGPAYLLGTPYIQTVGAAQFWPLALALVHIEEVRRAYNIQTNPDMAPGDFGWDPLGMKPKSEKELKELQNKELNNGRLAMFAVMGILGQELLTGQNQILNTR